MLKNVKAVAGFTIHATDGELGKVDEFLFDDRTWDIRYLVVETGGWLDQRKVLISTAALKSPDWRARSMPVALTREQVRTSPDIDTEQTVTRQHEIELHRHYAWPLYWGEGYYAGSMASGALYQQPAERRGAPEPASHLQGTRDVLDYRLHAADGQIGRVEDFIIDDRRWRIAWLVADTGTWLSGRKVLVSPHWIEEISWESSEVFVDLTRLAVQASPQYDPSQPVGEDYEGTLYDHYGRPKFEDVAAPQPAAKK